MRNFFRFVKYAIMAVASIFILTVVIPIIFKIGMALIGLVFVVGIFATVKFVKGFF